MKLFGRRAERRFAWCNQTQSDLLIWLEPWAEEFRVKPGARVEVVISGKRALTDEIPVDVTPTHLAIGIHRIGIRARSQGASCRIDGG